MNPLLTTPTTTPQAARDYLTGLHNAGMLYHLDDSAAEIINTRSGLRIFTDDEATQADLRAGECFEHLNNDPHEFCLFLINPPSFEKTIAMEKLVAAIRDCPLDSIEAHLNSIGCDGNAFALKQAIEAINAIES